ncbi:MAG: helix-turn-helix domain-containing protein [Candidatus Paceibacterota bacterium]|jgi:sugar-specific transcriptional regulator TrmB
MKEQMLKIEQLLKDSGFLDKEIAIYLTILELGRGTVAEISRKAGINRSTGYVILDSLVGKKLVKISGKEPKEEYAALSPANLVEYLEAQAKKQKTLADTAKEVLPELTSLYNVGDRPRVFFYEGFAGLEHVYEDSLTSKGDIYSTSTYEEMHETLPKYFETYYERRAKKKIFVHTFVADTPLARKRKSRDAIEYRDTSLVPGDKFPVPTDIEIYNDKVMIASWKEKLGVIIESKEIATTLRSVFKLALAEAKRLDN